MKELILAFVAGAALGLGLSLSVVFVLYGREVDARLRRLERLR